MRAACASPSSSSAGSPSGIRSWCRRSAQAGHEIGSHGYRHRCVRADAETPSGRTGGRRAALAAAGAHEVRGYRAPLWSINDRSIWALDVLAQARVSRSTRAWRRSKIVGNPDYPEAASPTIDALRRSARVPAASRPPLRPQHASWRRLGPADVVAGTGHPGYRGKEHARRPRRPRRSPLGARSQSAAVELPLAKSFAHYFRLRGFRDRLEQTLRVRRLAPMGEVLGSCVVST